MRPARIQQYIIEVLEEAREENKETLRFSELKARIEERIGRPLLKGSLFNALSALLNKGIIKRNFEKGTRNAVYFLTKEYEKTEMKNILLKIIEETPLEDIDFDFKEGSVIVITPGQKLLHGEEEENAEEPPTYFTPEWNKPSAGIAAVILNDFMKMPKNVQSGIVRLLFWCYWTEIQNAYYLRHLKEWVHNGKKIFNQLILNPGKQIYLQLPLEELPETDKRLLSSSVFNEFCRMILHLFRDVAAEIKGGPEYAKEQIALYKNYLSDLLALFKQRRFIIVYLFNIPTSRAEEKLYKLPAFEEWLNALQEGYLGHHSWLFEEETIKLVKKAYACVKRGQPPPSVHIDLEPWTLRDIYELHPRGRSQEFWRELLDLLRKAAEERVATPDDVSGFCDLAYFK